jgi:ankyrin repeat protein
MSVSWRRLHSSEWRILDAVRRGDAAEVDRLLRTKPALVRITDGERNTPLLLAAAHGHGGVVSLLLERGAYAAARDMLLGTALHAAARHGGVEAVSVLLQGGADQAATDDLGWTPLHLAARFGHHDVVALLLERGAEVNTRCQQPPGWTPLHLAVHFEQDAAAERLIEGGADRQAPDAYGHTPADVAGTAAPCPVTFQTATQGTPVAALLVEEATRRLGGHLRHRPLSAGPAD